APIVAPIMPPSITMIVYGVVSGTSIGQLFFAGIVPALLYIAMVMVTVHLTVRKRGFTDELQANTTNLKLIGKTPAEERPPFWPSLLGATPALLLPLLILGGIRFGWFTATEASAVAVIYALLV